jgi:hypothetical protein
MNSYKMTIASYDRAGTPIFIEAITSFHSFAGVVYEDHFIIEHGKRFQTCSQRLEDREKQRCPKVYKRESRFEKADKEWERRRMADARMKRGRYAG